MIDVFLSYTTRGLTNDEWIKSLREDLIRYYRSSYSKELNIWLAPVENGVGDNFRSQIAKALQQTAILMLILEPEYLNSPETIKEVNDYTDLRDNDGDLKHFIKVIVFRGKKTSELKSFISSDILSIDFFELIDGNQVPLVKGSREYISQIQNINKAIWIRQLDYCRKDNSEKIFNLLPKLPDAPKIYVGLSYSGKQDQFQRKRFIEQLKQTINREQTFQNALILPDELTTLGLTYDDLEELFFEDNEYGNKCIETLLNASSAIILRIINDDPYEAADLINNLGPQNKLIQNDQVLNSKVVTILADVPKEVYTTSKFFEQWDNPMYVTKPNFKLIKDKDINTFIDSYLNILRPILVIKQPPPPGPSAAKKYIFIIEPFYESPKDDSVSSRLEQELNNKRNFDKYIIEKGFTRLPAFPKNGNFAEAAKYNQRHLSMSDGVIIYYGVSNDRMWCLQQQSDTFSEIEAINLAKSRKIEKAVYLDPLQQNREPTDYSYFNYDVIATDPPELEQFLSKI